jgi:hypothetical protein
VTQPKIQWFDELGNEFARIAAEEGSRRTPMRVRRAFRPIIRRSVLTVMLSTFVLAVAGASVVPATRGAIGDIASSFAAWIAGDEQAAPGRALRPEDDAPDWVSQDSGRLIAESDGIGLYLTRRATEDGGAFLTFLLGKDGNAFGDTAEGWRERFKDHALIVLGTTPAIKNASDRLPLFGLTSRSVEHISLRYAEGPPLRADRLDGGFVLIADPRRGPREIIAYDAAGHELERFDVSGDRVTAFGVRNQD